MSVDVCVHIPQFPYKIHMTLYPLDIYIPALRSTVSDKPFRAIQSSNTEFCISKNGKYSFWVALVWPHFDSLRLFAPQAKAQLPYPTYSMIDFQENLSYWVSTKVRTIASFDWSRPDTFVAILGSGSKRNMCPVLFPFFLTPRFGPTFNTLGNASLRLTFLRANKDAFSWNLRTVLQRWTGTDNSTLLSGELWNT